MKIKKLLLAFLLSITFFVNLTLIKEARAELRVLCSFHPIYVFTQNVAKGSNSLKIDVLLPLNIGPHDYALTPGDMQKISQCDLLIINGMGIEEFLDKALKKVKSGTKIVNISEGIKPIPTRGAEEKGRKEHEHRHGMYNPHTWVSPTSAITQVRNIQKALINLDPKNANLYKANADSYVKKLESLSKEISEVLNKVQNKRIVTFHDAFDYFARDFGLEVVDVIEVVPGQEPSAGELAKLAKKIRELKVAAIFSEPQYSDRVAMILSKESGVPVFKLDPCHTGEGKPDTYEKVMRQNLEVLKKALNPTTR